MKTKYRAQIKINDVAVKVSFDLKSNEIVFENNGTVYHFTKEEQVEIQNLVRKLLKKVAEKKFKR